MRSGLTTHFGYIYKYTSPTNKVYIGQTKRINHRQQQHRWCSNNRPKSCFHRALRKYGYDNFKFEILIQFSSKDIDRLKYLLDELEKFYIRKYNSTNRYYGYNLTSGGEGLFNPSNEVREKLGRTWRGKHRSSVTKDKISKTLKDKYASGLPNAYARAIEMFDKENNLVKTFKSESEAQRFLNKKSMTSITNILHGRAKYTTEGFTFKYKELKNAQRIAWYRG